MAISFSRPDPSSPTAVADANFPTARRGFDQQEVREFLRMVAAELARMQDRERFLEHELRAMRQQRSALPSELDDEAASRLLGEETARIFQAARESSTAIRVKAEEAAERLLREAREESQALREAADLEASRRRKDADADAEAELAMAKQQGREMVDEARAYRERALGELARRRDLARQQIDQLVHGRDRLVQAFERARLVAADVVAELVPLGELDEYVNLSPTTGPVPVMVPASRLADASAISDDALALSARSNPDDPALDPDPPASPTAPAATDATRHIDRLLADDATSAPDVARMMPAEATGDTPAVENPGDTAVDTVVDTADDTADDTAVDTVVDTANDTAVDTADDTVVDTADDTVVDTANDTAVDTVVDTVVSTAPGDGSSEGAPATDSTSPVASGDTGAGPDLKAPPSGGPTGTPLSGATVLQFPGGTTRAGADGSTAGDFTVAGDATASGYDDEISGEISDDDEIDDDDVTATDVDDLFSRLRSQRESGDETGATVAGGDDSGLSPFDRRDEALTPLIVASARKLKRVLADEQNALLDTLRRREPVRSLDDLVAGPDEHGSHYFDAISGDLLAAAESGAESLGGATLDAGDGGVLAPVRQSLLSDLVGPLRDRLADRVAAGDGDNEAITKSVRATYREWKTKHIDDHLDDLLRVAYGRGAFAALETGEPCRWLVDPSVGPCSDCEDNSLQGAVPAGDAFPTGHMVAPAHTGCRCLLARAAR